MLKKKRYRAKFVRLLFIDERWQYEWLIFDQTGIFLGRYRAMIDHYWATIDPTAPRLPDIKL